MKEHYDNQVKEWWPLKNDNLTIKLQDGARFDDQDIAKSFNQMPCPLGSCMIGLSKRLMNVVIREKDGFNSSNVYYGDTDSAYIHKKTMVHVR